MTAATFPSRREEPTGPGGRDNDGPKEATVNLISGSKTEHIAARRRGARMTAKRKSTSGWQDGYAALPRVFYTTEEFRALSPQARSLLIEYALRFKGNNNGNLEMTEQQFATAGLGTPTTFRRYNTELINAGWIVVTRQGGLGKCSLYALTYLRIDKTEIRYDHPITAGAPCHLWRSQNKGQRDARQKPTQRNRLKELLQRSPDRASTESRPEQLRASGV